jgi:hypothetical protein
MKLNQKEENLTTRYLLGDLSEDEKQQVEAQFFNDDTYYENLLVAEDDLIYTYLQGGLSARQRQLFETQLAASARRREKVEVIRVLMAEASAVAHADASLKAPDGEMATTAQPKTPLPEGRASWWQAIQAAFAKPMGALQFAMFAAMVLLAVAGVWLWVQTGNLKSRVEIAEAKSREAEQQASEYRQRELSATEQASQLQSRNQALNEQVVREQQARQAAEQARAELAERLQEESHNLASNQADSVVSFALESGIRRDDSDEPQRLRLPQKARRIQLQLDLGSDDGKGFYRAEVKTFGGALVWSKDALSAASTSWGKAVNFVLPTTIFKNGEYELTLKRIRGQGQFEDAAYYYFKIEKP